ncbi:MAG: glycosyltransferase family 2 protein [Candidatus Moraniibacteriota bacterium]|nr:MAG: glycosyltransferase family 2 protein [Candidatus Moranbacteria bacterium]
MRLGGKESIWGLMLQYGKLKIASISSLGGRDPVLSVVPTINFPMTVLPTISLIFVNYRSVWELALALESLFAHEKEAVSYEIIVVNNDHEEEKSLQALAKQCAFRVLTPPQNDGFGAGVNLGVAEARGAIVGILNPDVRFVESFLRVVQELLERDPALLCAPTLVTLRGEEEANSFGSAPSLRRIVEIHSGRRWRGKELDWMSGAALFLTRERFLSLQGFDAGYFLYFEDVDLCLRAKEMGSKLKRMSARLVHVGGKSFLSRRHQKGHYYDSQRRYFQTYRPKWETFVLHLVHRIIAPFL